MALCWELGSLLQVWGDKIISDLVHKNQSTVYPTLFQSAPV